MKPQAVALLAWTLFWTTGSAAGISYPVYPTEASCNADGRKMAADAKAQEAKDEADAIKDHGYFATTIGYDVEWKCTEDKNAKPQATK